MQGPYACILFDTTFKVVLCNPRNEKLMIQILELLIPGKRIQSIEFLDKEKHGLEINEKSVTFDMLCRERNTGEEFLVEVQNEKQDGYTDRMLSYSTYPIREQMEKRIARLKDEEPIDRMDYKLKPVYVLSFLNFTLDHESDAGLDESGLISRYSLRNDRNAELMTDALHFIYVEMGRLRYRSGEEAKCKTLLEKFIFSMKYIHRMTARPESFREDMLSRLYEATLKANLTIDELQKYDKTMYTELDRVAQMNYARKEGMEEGIAKGEAKGRAEVAKEMLKHGISLETVISCTGLSQEAVESLR